MANESIEKNILLPCQLLFGIGSSAAPVGMGRRSGDPGRDHSWWGITEPSQKTLGEVQVGDWKE